MHTFVTLLSAAWLALGATAVPTATASAPAPPAYSTPTPYFPSSNSSSTSSNSSAQCSFWLDEIKHQGVAAFNPDASYQVYRNVKDYGAKGDGRTDDTAAIQAAIASGNRVDPTTDGSSTTTLAVVYIPPGDYLISRPIVDYFYTQIIGNPLCVPTFRAAQNFSGNYVIDGDPNLATTATNLFYREVRNLIVDMTSTASSNLTGINWATAQATSLQNMVFKMSQAHGTQQVGVSVDGGSGGFLSDLIFEGGYQGMSLSNQQFTMRNLSFTNTVTAIQQQFDWGWTFMDLFVKNSSVALNMSSGGSSAQAVAAVTVIDSTFEDCEIGVLTAHSSSSQPPASGVLNVENVIINNVPTAIKGADRANSLTGSRGATVIPAWSDGHRYTPIGVANMAGPISPNPRSGSLLGPDGRFYFKSKPGYASVPLSSFVSARSLGATGNGVTDDTAALSQAIATAAASQKILFVDAGTYRVTKTIQIPPGSKIIGEGFSSIMSSGSFFDDMKNPQPVVRIGEPGQVGQVELSNLIMSTQSDPQTKQGQAGAVLIEYNLFSTPQEPSGLWNVHNRISGFTGSNQQVADCPVTPNTTTTNAGEIDPQCLTAFMSMHVTQSAAGLYMENNWLWTADHDLDTPDSTQITVYTGRGLLVESVFGTIWLWGTAVEHHALYQYQFLNTRDVVMGQIQTETPYWQPNPNATVPYPPVASLDDPTFPAKPFVVNGTVDVPNADAWGIRFIASQSMFVYGAGHYSFFDNYSTTCNADGLCQSRIFSVERGSTVYLYDLHTVGTQEMITVDGRDIASRADNSAGFTANIALYRSY